MTETAELTLESEKAIRGYVLKLFALPGIVAMLITFFLGYFVRDVRDVAEEKAELEAMVRVHAELFEFERGASALRAKAETTFDATLETLEDIEELNTKAKTYEGMAEVGDFVTAVSASLSSDPGILAAAQAWPAGGYCIFARECPDGMRVAGTAGFILGAGGTCPFAQGGAYNAGWIWCHPTLCCAS